MAGRLPLRAAPQLRAGGPHHVAPAGHRRLRAPATADALASALAGVAPCGCSLRHIRLQPPSNTVAALTHIRLQAWDHAVDLCLAQLPALVPPSPLLHTPASPPAYVATAFFTDQLTALEICIAHALRAPPGKPDARPLQHLPLLLQAMLSQSHRMRALQLLAAFLRLGGWAVQQALNVGLFQYVAKLLHLPVRAIVRVGVRVRVGLGLGLGLGLALALGLGLRSERMLRSG